MGMFMLEGRGNREEAARRAERAGAPQIATVLRAAVEPVGLSQLSDFKLMAGGFANALVSHGLFDAALDSMKRVPLATAGVGNVSIGAIAGISEERGVKVVSRLTIEDEQLTPIKVAVIVALTNELLLATSSEAQRIVSRELINACALAADQNYWPVPFRA